MKNLCYSLAAQACSFFHSPPPPPPPPPSPPQPFPNTVSQDTFGTLLLTVQYFGDLRDAIPCHCSPSTSHPALPREAEDFPAGGKYPKDGPLPTFLACLQSV